MWFASILAARSIRGIAYGALPVVLGIALARRGFSMLEVGAALSLALASGAVFSALSGAFRRKFGTRVVLVASSAVMAAAAVVVALAAPAWAAVLALCTGTFAAGAQDVGPFAALEQTVIAENSQTGDAHRYAVYNAVALVAVAIGSLVAAFVSITAVLLGYGACGLIMAVAYLFVQDDSHGVSPPPHLPDAGRPKNKGIEQLAVLFGLDAFAGGFIVQSVIAFWLHERFGVGTGQIGVVLAIANGLSAASFFAAASLARRFGLLNTMVFTHLPSNVLLFVVAVMPTFPLAVVALLLRFALSQMDVPTRQAFVMAVAPPEDRARAAGLTLAVRPAAAAAAPVLSGAAMQAAASGLPFVISGSLKILYDLLLFWRFRGIKLT